MFKGERKEPEGLSNQEDVAIQTNLSLLGSPSESEDDVRYSSLEELCESLSQTSLQSVDSSWNNTRFIEPSSNDIPVCLHEGLQGGGPVLINLPFQSLDSLQTFVPCTDCHGPHAQTTPSHRATETIAFCVSEVSIRMSQLTLVPCQICWNPLSSSNGLPEKIRVPLFANHPLLGGDRSSADSGIRFVPCMVCLQSDHGLPQEDEQQLLTRVETRGQQTSTDLDEVRLPEEKDDEVLVSWFIPFRKTNQITSLQMSFLRHCSSVIQNSKRRQREIPKLAQVRTLRACQKCKQHSKPAQHSIKPQLPSQSSLNIFTHRTMRQQTERIYSRLMEGNKEREKWTRDQQMHRIMAHIFQKKLQQATLRGKVSWQITETCM